MKSHYGESPATSAQNLPDSEAFELVLNNLEDHFLLLDSSLNIILANKSTIEKIKQGLGITIEKGMSVLKMVPPERQEGLNKLYESVLAGHPQVSDIEIKIGDQKHWYKNSFMPAYNKEGIISGIIISSRNITEQKKAEKEQEKAEYQLKLSEFQYRSMFNSNPLPCYIYSIKSLKILQINEAAIKYYGIDRKEIEQLSIFDLYHSDHHNHVKERIEKEGASFHYAQNAWKIIRRDGEESFADLRISAVLIQDEEARLVVSHDVTSVTQAEAALRISNERFNLMAQAASEALWEWNEETGEAYISPSYLQMMGWNPEEFRKLDSWPDYIHPEDREETLSGYFSNLNDPTCFFWKAQYRYRKSNGEYAFVSDKAVLVRNKEGKLIKVVGALQDISEQKIIEEELKASNQRFLLAARASSDAIYEFNLISNKLWWSEGLFRLFGHQSSDLSIEKWSLLIHPSDSERVNASLTNALQDSSVEFWNEEYRFMHAGGFYRHALDRAYIDRDSDCVALRMIGSMQDITERKTNELLLSLERSVLELSTESKTDISTIVHYLLRGIEVLDADAMTVVMVPEENSYKTIASHKVPLLFNQVISDLKPGQLEQNILASTQLKKTIVTSHIQQDPAWESLRHFAQNQGIQSCWSFPIISSSGNTLGVFNVFYSTPRHEAHTTLSNLERLRNILRVIMEQQWSVEQLRLINERFDKMMKATHDLIWDWNLVTNTIYRDPEALLHVFGVHDNNGIENFESWNLRVHPEDRKGLEEKIRLTMERKGQSQFEAEYRFLRDDGNYTYIYDRGILLRDETGRPIRMIGAAQDISDRKRLERELLTNELEYQKAINKATVETQEQERSEIGKDLHDNVNQVLTTTKLYLDLAMSSPEMKDDLILKSSTNINSVINEIRQLSRSLMDPSIGDLGLTDSINDLIDNINYTRKLHITLHADSGIDGIIDRNQKLTVFRIIQEALNNAVRHSQASEVIIRMQESGGEIKVSIEDNGIGFDPKTIKKGAGLKNIQNRIYLINGRHAFESRPSQGSKIIITFPIIQSKS